MILNICFIILFLLGFIVLSIKGYKNRNYWYQLVALNSLIAFTNSLKEILPSTFDNIINLIRITVGLFVIIIFFYSNFQNKKTSNG